MKSYKIGLMVYLPLDPRTAIFLYDPDCYQIQLNSNFTFELFNENDIENLNLMQIVNCKHNIYCKDENQALITKELINKKDFKQFNPDKHTFYFEESGHTKFLFFSTNLCNYPLELTFLKINTNLVPSPIRNKKLVHLAQRELKKVIENYKKYKSLS